MSDYVGHVWVLARWDTDKRVSDAKSMVTAKVSTEVGDALDQFLTNVFEGIRDGCLEVIMSEEDSDV